MDDSNSNRESLTRILGELGTENAEAAQERLYPVVYSELREIAERLMRTERAGHTLQPTALVHEAYFKLVTGETPRGWTGRAHFFGVAARAMRQVLIDHARKRSAQKRNAAGGQVTFDEALFPGSAPEVEILRLDEILTKLTTLDERMARVVELRVFGGLSIEEITEVLGVSRRTVDRDWNVAKMWFVRELGQET